MFRRHIRCIPKYDEVEKMKSEKSADKLMLESIKEDISFTNRQICDNHQLQNNITKYSKELKLEIKIVERDIDIFSSIIDEMSITDGYSNIDDLENLDPIEKEKRLYILDKMEALEKKLFGFNTEYNLLESGKDICDSKNVVLQNRLNKLNIHCTAYLNDKFPNAVIAKESKRIARIKEKRRQKRSDDIDAFICLFILGSMLSIIIYLFYSSYY